MKTRRSFLGSGLRSLAWLGAGLGAAWWLRDQVFWPIPDARSIDGPASTGPLPFANPRSGLVTIAATVTGRSIAALIDSGAQYSVVDRNWATEAGLEPGLSPPMIAVGVGGGAQLGRGVTSDVTLGALTLKRLRLAQLELGPITQAIGAPVPLILGQDVLGALVAEIDYPGGSVELHRADRWMPGADAEPVAAAHKQGRGLNLPVVVEGRPVDALIDTGSTSALALTTDAAQTAGLLDGRPRRAGRSVVLGGVVEGFSVRAATLDVGGEVLRDVEVAVFPPVKAPGFPDALLGGGALRESRVALDLGDGRMFRL